MKHAHTLRIATPDMASAFLVLFSFTLQVAPTATAMEKRGFFLHLPAQQQPLRRLDLTLGRAEFEYLEIDCATREPGEATLHLQIPAHFPGHADVLVEEDHRLLPRHTLTLHLGERNPLWIRFSTHGVPAGTYVFRLKVHPKAQPATETTLALKVMPIERPQLDDVYVSAFWSGFFCIFGGLGRLYSDVREPTRRIQLWERCLEDQQNWGQNILEVRFVYGSKEDPLLPQYLRVSHFEKGRLPVLDFSGWNPILDAALRHGMKHVVFRYGYLSPSWRPPGYERLSREQQQEVDFFLLSQILKHLQSRGFQRMFWYLIDELAPYASTVDPVLEKIRTHKVAFPHLEFAGSGFAHHGLKDWDYKGVPRRGLEHLAPYLGWMAPYWGVQSAFQWLRNGDLKLAPGGVVATQLSADPKGPYVENRRLLWLLWLSGGTGYQIYGYHTHYPQHQYSAVFPGDERPIYSPVYASLVDGHEDFQYLHLCTQVLRNLSARGDTERAHAFQAEMEKIIGRPDSLLPLKQKPPAPYDPARAPIPYLECDEAALRQARARIMELLLQFQPQPQSNTPR